MFARLPQELQDGASIRIVPVVFNIGIDHRASIARVFTLEINRKSLFLAMIFSYRLNLFSATQVENDLNYKNLDKLKTYVHQSVNNLPGLSFSILENQLVSN